MGGNEQNFTEAVWQPYYRYTTWILQYEKQLHAHQFLLNHERLCNAKSSNCVAQLHFGTEPSMQKISSIRASGYLTTWTNSGKFGKKHLNQGMYEKCIWNKKYFNV